VLNATPVPRHDYRVGVPRPGFYKEILNSDSAIYGGSNVGNSGGTYTEVGQYHGHGQFVSLSLPPLGVLVLKPITAAKR
ncbi:MAG TPA: alpha amylase C-terminal domain-containing protein, partial [Planctomycetaceae bacterium]|nr:alpha amylase C-terminal domain-containing protein [Planctomycetaceae bacterium]